MGRMTKNEAIEMLGGTPKLAAKAMRYRAVQTIYMWPDVLTQEVADRVRGAAARLRAGECDAQRAETTAQEVAHG